MRTLVKPLLVIITCLLATLYALPNFWGEAPALIIRVPADTETGIGNNKHKPSLPSTTLQADILQVLAQHQLYPKFITTEVQPLLLRFVHIEEQLLAQTILQKHFNNNLLITPCLTALTPKWLTTLGLHPMKLGLDLRGGIRFLMEINSDVDAVVEQTVTIIRRRVNELGVAEAIVQRQGNNLLAIELPGIQDANQARHLLGKTATLDFVFMNEDVTIPQLISGQLPPNNRIVYSQDNQPIVVEKTVILTGDAVQSASAQLDNYDNKPVVLIRLSSHEAERFTKITQENIGRMLAVIYRESKQEGKYLSIREEIISIARLQSALGQQFQITGLEAQEAQELALLLRAGSLPTTVKLVEDKILGPSLGRDNIHKGLLSITIGVGSLLLFMPMYYGMLGIVADIALAVNFICLLALMSICGSTLTLPGIAGIILTLGMAVDASILIFERMREEGRAANCSLHYAIKRGFNGAFNTILDSNLTSLIVGILLFIIGTGPVRGFAVTLSLGIITSLFSAVTVSRIIIDSLQRYAPKLLRIGL
jgi:preprotein translocase subunit SecD